MAQEYNTMSLQIVVIRVNKEVRDIDGGHLPDNIPSMMQLMEPIWMRK